MMVEGAIATVRSFVSFSEMLMAVMMLIISAISIQGAARQLGLAPKLEDKGEFPTISNGMLARFVPRKPCHGNYQEDEVNNRRGRRRS